MKKLMVMIWLIALPAGAGPISFRAQATDGRGEFLVALDVPALVRSWRTAKESRAYVEEAIGLEAADYAANSDPATGEILDAPAVEKVERVTEKGKIKRLSDWAADNAGELTIGGLLAALVYAIEQDDADSNSRDVSMTAGGDITFGGRNDNSIRDE